MPPGRWAAGNHAQSKEKPLMTTKRKTGPAPKPAHMRKRAYGFSLLPETVDTVKAIAALTPYRSEGSVVAEAVALLARFPSIQDALQTAYSLIIRHHEAGIKQEAGCFCPVCHREDGTEPEIDKVYAALYPMKGAKP